MCLRVVLLPLRGPSVYVSVSHSECLQSGPQSRCWGAQMHFQARVLCSLNSVNPSAVPKLRTRASPVFSPLSRIFTLPLRANNHKTDPTFSALLSLFFAPRRRKKHIHFKCPELFSRVRSRQPETFQRPSHAVQIPSAVEE